MQTYERALCRTSGPQDVCWTLLLCACGNCHGRGSDQRAWRNFGTQGAGAAAAAASLPGGRRRQCRLRDSARIGHDLACRDGAPRMPGRAAAAELLHRLLVRHTSAGRGDSLA
eukprot:357392-Chlamydomonas_euryale.AAC.8